MSHTLRATPITAHEPADPRPASRRATDDLLRRALALPEQDAALLHAVYVDHMRMTSLAALTGIPIRALRRRLRSLTQRLMTPEFDFIAARAHTWPAPRRQIAHALFILGKPLRQTARDLGLSLHTVRQHAAHLGALCEAARTLAAEFARRERTIRDA